MTNLVAVLGALCAECGSMLKESVWVRAHKLLLEVFASAEAEVKDRQMAMSGAVKACQNRDHWQVVVDFLKGDFSAFHQEVEKDFFDRCDRQVLGEFVAGENGIVSTALLTLATTEGVLTSRAIWLAHLAITGLSTMAKEDAQFVAPMRQVCELMEKFCLFYGENGVVPISLARRFEHISTQFPVPTTAPAPKPTQLVVKPVASPLATVPQRPGPKMAKLAKKKEQAATAAAASNGGTHQPFSVLAGFKPSAPTVSPN